MNNIVITILTALPTIAFIVMLYFLKNYLPKKIQNLATIQDIKDITYETKKGENLATKEDIEEITKKVETVKTEFLKEVEHLKGELLFQNAIKSIMFNDRKDAVIKLWEALNLWHTTMDTHFTNCIEYKVEEFSLAEKEIERLEVVLILAESKADLYVDDLDFFNSLTKVSNKISELEKLMLKLFDQLIMLTLPSGERQATTIYTKATKDAQEIQSQIYPLLYNFRDFCFKQISNP